MDYFSLILCVAISALISIGVPAALLVYWRRRTHASVLPAMVGAATFILFALVLEQLLHVVVLKLPAVTGNTALYVLYAGFAAGIFEETGRWFAFRFLLRRRRGRETAITYGIGHGGIEAILITGVSMISNLVLIAILMTKGESGLSAFVGSENAPALISSYQTTPPALFLVGGLERVIAIALHIALSVFVFRAVRERRIGDFLLAVLFHALVDCFAVLYSVHVIGSILVIELGVLVMTVGIAFLARRAYREMEEEPSIAEEESAYEPEQETFPVEEERDYGWEDGSFPAEKERPYEIDEDLSPDEEGPAYETEEDPFPAGEGPGGPEENA